MKIWNKKLKIRKEPKLMQINVEEFKWDINVCVKEHIIHAHYVNTEHNKSKYIFMWYKKNLQKNSTQTHASGILFLGKSIYHPHWVCECVKQNYHTEHTEHQECRKI